MSTLHLYHWRNQQTLTQHLQLMGHSDSLVIYGELSDEDLIFTQTAMISTPHSWYLVKTGKDPIKDAHEINVMQWQQLITEHNNTWAWK